MNFKINEKVKYLNSMLCEIDSIYQTILLNKGISDSEYVVLFSILELGEGCLQKDIVNIGYINKKTANSTIKKLEKNGLLILKAGKYPNMHIFLTEIGREYVKDKIVPIIDFETNVMKNMPDVDFIKLEHFYSKYIAQFKKEIAKL